MDGVLKTLKIAGLVLGCFLLAHLIRTAFRPSPVDIVTAANRTLLHDQAWYRRVDSLRSRVASLSQRAQEARRAQIGAQGQVDSLSQALEAATSLRDSFAVSHESGVVLAVALRRCDDAFVADSTALAACAEQGALLAQRVDTLQRALARQIGVSRCRVLFLPCLSRMQSLELGLLLGGVTGFWLGK